MSNKKSSTVTEDEEEKKKARNLYKALTNDSKSVFYATNKITKTLVKRARNSLYKKDTVFVNIYNLLETKYFLKLETLPLSTPFVKKRQNIILTTLYSFSGPCQALQADIAYISFLARSAVDPKFCLLIAALFTSKIYTYPMKTRNLSAKKMELFYDDINKKRDDKMGLQTDQEFKQRKIIELHKKINVEMYSTNLRDGKAFAAEQKIRELKKTLLRSKRMKKFKGKRIKSNELIRKATFNLNNTRSGYSPQQIEEQALDPKMRKYFQEVLIIVLIKVLIKLKENRDQLERFDAKVDRRNKRLREHLDIDEKVFILAERQEDYTKAQPKTKLFLTEIKFLQ